MQSHFEIACDKQIDECQKAAVKLPLTDPMTVAMKLAELKGRSAAWQEAKTLFKQIDHIDLEEAA